MKSLRGFLAGVLVVSSLGFAACSSDNNADAPVKADSPTTTPDAPAGTADAKPADAKPADASAGGG